MKLYGNFLLFTGLFMKVYGSDLVDVKFPLVQAGKEDVDDAGRIVFGTVAKLGLLPWQAGITVTTANSSSFWCGGSVIHKSWVLTAGHCTVSATMLEVRLGSLSPSSGGVLMTSRTAYTHTSFNSRTRNNDIGIIKMPSPITFTNYINSIKILPSTYTNPLPELTVSGWGRTSSNTSGTSPKLMYAQVKVINNTLCQKVYGSSVVINTTLCTMGTNAQGPCQGDSGGPLVILSPTPYLVGQVSFIAVTGCETGYPAGYVRVTNYRAWIFLITGLLL